MHSTWLIPMISPASSLCRWVRCAHQHLASLRFLPKCGNLVSAVAFHVAVGLLLSYWKRLDIRSRCRRPAPCPRRRTRRSRLAATTTTTSSWPTRISWRPSRRWTCRRLARSASSWVSPIQLLWSFLGLDSSFLYGNWENNGGRVAVQKLNIYFSSFF